jgi:hypothetical protein
MITNNDITIYHKTFDKKERVETWERYNYDNVWFFGSHGAGINKGYENANNVDVRISYKEHEIDISKFAIGDLLVKGKLEINIESKQDLNDYDVYEITLINNNNFGNRPHLRLGGK